MVWYLLICSMAQAYNVTCEPIQYMTNYEECQFVYRQYQEVAKEMQPDFERRINGRCIRLNRLQGK